MFYFVNHLNMSFIDYPHIINLNQVQPIDDVIELKNEIKDSLKQHHKY